MNPFASETKVPVERTRAEIEALVVKHGADAFRSGWNREGNATVEFKCKGRLVRFALTTPSRDDPRFKRSPAGRYALNQGEQLRAWEQACRQRWRALLLVIKAKLEAVEAGISVFDDEFLAQLVDPISNRTVGEHVRPAIAARYDGQDRPLGLPDPEGK